MLYITIYYALIVYLRSMNFIFLNSSKIVQILYENALQWPSLYEKYSSLKKIMCDDSMVYISILVVHLSYLG